MTPQRDARTFRGGRLIAAAAVIGAVGLALWGLGLAVDGRRALFAYLTAWSFAVFTVVSALILQAIGYATNAKWIVSVRRLLDAITAALPVLAVGFVPVALGLDELYMWTDPPPHLPEHELHVLHHKQPFLNETFFIVRAVAYFAVWIAVSVVLRAWSRQRERLVEAGTPLSEDEPNGRERVAASVALPPLALTVTFAAFDWIMSLMPLWFSTIFGVYVFAGGILAAVALVTLLAYGSVRSGALAGLVTRYHFHALGRLLLAFVAFWAYCAFFQALLIRLANLPEEVVFYLDRIGPAWQWAVWVLLFGHFVAPFAILLLRSIKHVPAAMGALSVWLLVMCYLDTCWLVLPALPGEQGLHWVDAVAPFAVLGPTVAFAAWRQRGRSLLAEGDPYLERGLAYESKS